MLFKGQQIVVAVGAWALLALTLLTLFGSLDYAYFFAIAFLGYLVVTSLASPYVARPPWRSRLNYVGAAGALIFCLLVLQKAMLFWGK